MGGILFLLRWTHCLNSVTKMPDMRTHQNEHKMLLSSPRCLSILQLQTSKTDNNALDIDAIYNLKLRKITRDSFSTKLKMQNFHGLPLC
jgi:hypothetical protein